MREEERRERRDDGMEPPTHIQGFFPDKLEPTPCSNNHTIGIIAKGPRNLRSMGQLCFEGGKGWGLLSG